MDSTIYKKSTSCHWSDIRSISYQIFTFPPHLFCWTTYTIQSCDRLQWTKQTSPLPLELAFPSKQSKHTIKYMYIIGCLVNTMKGEGCCVCVGVCKADYSLEGCHKTEKAVHINLWGRGTGWDGKASAEVCHWEFPLSLDWSWFCLFFFFWCWGSNPGHHAHQAGTLSLRYRPLELGLARYHPQFLWLSSNHRYQFHRLVHADVQVDRTRLGLFI